MYGTQTFSSDEVWIIYDLPVISLSLAKFFFSFSFFLFAVLNPENSTFMKQQGDL